MLFFCLTNLQESNLFIFPIQIWLFLKIHDVKLELVSKELNHFGGSRRFSEIGHQGQWQVVHK